MNPIIAEIASMLAKLPEPVLYVVKRMVAALVRAPLVDKLRAAERAAIAAGADAVTDEIADEILRSEGQNDLGS